MSISSDEEKLATSSTVDKRERDTSGKGIDSSEYSTEDKGEFAPETKVLFENWSTTRKKVVRSTLTTYNGNLAHLK